MIRQIQIMGFEGDQVHLEISFVKEMQEKIYQSISHSYLNKYFHVPQLDSDKLYLLLSVLKSKNFPTKKMESVAKTVMYIQVALDSHDLVKNDLEGQKYNLLEQKEQQLTVLAGDYYSGLYYRTLSFLPEIPLIKQLASAIKIINEQKIRVYKVEITSLEDFFLSMQQIETLLYQKLASFYQLSDFEMIATNWLHMNQILKNKEKYINYMIENRLINMNNVDDDPRALAENRLYQYIQELDDQLKKYVKNDALIKQFSKINDTYLKNLQLRL